MIIKINKQEPRRLVARALKAARLAVWTAFNIAMAEGLSDKPDCADGGLTACQPTNGSCVA